MVEKSGNRPYQVDDILEEARQKKLERQKTLPSAQLEKSKKPEIPVDFGTLVPKKQRMQKQQPENSSISDQLPENKRRAQKESGIKTEAVSRNQKSCENLDATRSFPIEHSDKMNMMQPDTIQEEEEPVKIFVARQPFVETKAFPSSLHTPDQDSAQELDQIQIDSLLENIPQDETESLSDDWEDQLQKERRKKAENFKLHPPVALRLSGEEEDNDPSEEPDSFVDEEIEDYCSYEDTDAVRSELIYRRRTGWLQLILTGVLSLTLIGTSILYFIQWTSINPVLFVSLNVFLLAITALINHRAVGEGLSALVHFRANIDSMTSVITLLTILQTLLQYFNSEVLTGGKATILAPVAASALWLGVLGRQMLVLRIAHNFKFVSYRGDKYAAHIIENRKTAAEVGRSAVAIGEPVVCYLEKADFLTRFLENSYEINMGDRTMRFYVPCTVGASAILAGVFAVLGGSILNAVTVFVSSVCLAAPVGVVTASNFPLLRAAKRVLRHGAMLLGWQSAEEFGNIHALAVDAQEVFPSESVLLHGIKTFSGTRIDDAILDAAAVSIAAGGPLSNVFRRVIQSRTDILKEVDTLVYEQDMGMSGWVGGRRVLIGNRRLLENHGVDVPSRDYEARYTKDARQIVYLSTAGELSAMFIISYVADEGIAKSLKNMCGSGITLLVRTCDPNVTEDLICQTYGLDPYYVEVMSAPAGRSYEQLLTLKSEENEAVLASNGRLEGIAYGVTYCRRLFKAIRLSMIIQVIGGVLGISLSVLLALYAGIFIPPLLVVCYSVIWTLLSWILPCAYRV